MNAQERAARREALRRAANELALVTRPAEVRRTIAAVVEPTVGTDAVAIAVPDGDGGAVMTVVTAPGTAFEGRTRTLSLDDSHPIVDTIRDGRSRMFASLEDLTAVYPSLEERARRSGDASWAHVALRHGDRVLGAIGLAFDDPHAFAAEDEALFREFAHMCLAATERARLYEAEHSISLALQHGLLAHPAPTIAGVDIATRYVPAYRRLEVGGDWHQAFRLPDGRLGLSVGDVVGKGAAAASTMGQLRSALAGAAMASPEPDDVLRSVRRAAAIISGADAATLAYAVLDPAAGTLRYVRAGHPYPFIVRADGGVERLDDGAALPLLPWGIDDPPVGEATLREGDRLVLYTDGLVERRGEPLDVGLDRLRSALEDARDRGAGALCDVISDAMLTGDEPRDDVALLCAELTAR